MLKKLKKYLKFMICCALMLSLIAPSYAALSASDGSAFVTKAEFDNALADFNARLTTFEAGINSKIDSQVTSYLDRNGIWSGKDQEDFKSTELTWDQLLGHIKNYINDYLTATDGTDEYVFFKDLFLKPNKSGLAVVTLHGNMDWYMGWLTFGEHHKLAQGSFRDTSRIEDSAGNVMASPQLIRGGHVWGYGTWNPVFNFLGTKEDIVCLFFVNTKDTYYFTLAFKFDGRPVNGTKATLPNPQFSVQSGNLHYESKIVVY